MTQAGAARIGYDMNVDENNDNNRHLCVVIPGSNNSKTSGRKMTRGKRSTSASCVFSNSNSNATSVDALSSSCSNDLISFVVGGSVDFVPGF